MKTYGKIDSFKKMNIKVILNDKDVIYEGNAGMLQQILRKCIMLKHL